MEANRYLGHNHKQLLYSAVKSIEKMVGLLCLIILSTLLPLIATTKIGSILFFVLIIGGFIAAIDTSQNAIPLYP